MNLFTKIFAHSIFTYSYLVIRF